MPDSAQFLPLLGDQRQQRLLRVREFGDSFLHLPLFHFGGVHFRIDLGQHFARRHLIDGPLER